MTALTQNTRAEALESLHSGRNRLAAGEAAQAIESLQHAIALQPNLHEAHFLLGRAFSRLGRDEDARAFFTKALEIDPTQCEYHYSLGGLFMKLGRFGQAAEHYRAVLAIQPEQIECYNALGIALSQLNNFKEAAVCYQKAIALNPGYIDAYNGLGLLLMQLGDASSAEQCLRIALQLWETSKGDETSGKGIAPGRVIGEASSWQLLLNLGRTLDFQGKLEAAIDCYRKAIRQSPDTALLHVNLALDLLATGQLLEGWQEYEWRWKLNSSELLPRNFSCPQWTGQALHGEKILLHAEQGYGDTIQFVRYARSVAEMGGKVILEVQPRLHRLLEEIPGVEQVVSKGEPLPEFSWHCPLMSLPLAFGTTIETIPATAGYLHVSEQQKVKALESLPGEGLRVGLAWAGNMKSTQDTYRSLPLNQLSALGEVQGISFYSLQVGNATTQLAEVAPQISVTDACSGYTDFADTAAVIAGLDLVITVDTSIAHLAGALGVPVWVMLPLNRTDWRWFLERNDSPWYPSARLFRQQKPGDWNGVVLQIKSELEALVKNKCRKGSRT